MVTSCSGPRGGRRSCWPSLQIGSFRENFAKENQASRYQDRDTRKLNSTTLPRCPTLYKSIFFEKFISLNLASLIWGVLILDNLSWVAFPNLSAPFASLPCMVLHLTSLLDPTLIPRWRCYEQEFCFLFTGIAYSSTCLRCNCTISISVSHVHRLVLEFCLRYISHRFNSNTHSQLQRFVRIRWNG